jgi:predicted metal-binding protein
VTDASTAAGPVEESARGIEALPEALRRDAATLVERARALGADRVAPLPAAGVVVDERVRLKCLVPRCSSYGKNLMCPPAVPAPDEMRAALARYRLALVVQQRIPANRAAADEAFAGRTYAEGRAEGGRDGDGDGRVAVGGVLASQAAFARLMSALERAAFGLGYRFAAAFAGGECVLCEECVGQGSGAPCKHPFEARPSAEALGVDLVATAQAAGLDVTFPAADDARWTGLLLID